VLSKEVRSKEVRSKAEAWPMRVPERTGAEFVGTVRTPSAMGGSEGWAPRACGSSVARAQASASHSARQPRLDVGGDMALCGRTVGQHYNISERACAAKGGIGFRLGMGCETQSAWRSTVVALAIEGR